MNAKATSNKLLRDSMRMAELLNDRFVALGRLLDSATNASKVKSAMQKAMGRDGAVKADRAGAPSKNDPRHTPRRAVEMARRVRTRLSDLHLRVGQSIYEVEARGPQTARVTEQLCALLDEIERLEDVLRRLGAESRGPQAAQTLTEAESLFGEPPRAGGSED